MSGVERKVAHMLQHRGVHLELQPRCRYRDGQPEKTLDFLVAPANVFVEVKGFMTVEQIAWMADFCRQSRHRFYILQATETLWNPFPDPLDGVKRPTPSDDDRQRDRLNLERQADELAWLADNGAAVPCERQNLVMLARLRRYVEAIIADEKNGRDYSNWLRE
jgi:hypothetical protein